MAASKTSKKKDLMLVGFSFPYDKDRNPYDFIDPVPPQTRARERSGSMLHDLTRGLSGVIIPPLLTWKEGDWWDDEIHGKKIPEHQWPVERDRYDAFVVSGEGTPGDWVFRIYVLPEEVSRHDLEDNNLPKHPEMWPKALKDKLKGQTASSYSSYSSWSSGTTTTKSSMPYGLRIVCVHCGHWFEADDISGHLQCCPTVQGMSDWALKCECCASMDDTVKVKPGFPREPIIPKEATDGDSDSGTERAPAAAADAAGSGGGGG